MLTSTHVCFELTNFERVWIVVCNNIIVKLCNITLVRLSMVLVLFIHTMPRLLIKPGCSLTIMIFIFNVFITADTMGGKWLGLLGSPKVPGKQTVKLLKKNINLKMNETLFCIRPIAVAQMAYC